MSEYLAVGGTYFKRLIRMIALIEQGYASSIELLAADLEVSRRTAFRDLDVLREAGFSIQWHRQRGYRIVGSGEVPSPPATGLDPVHFYAFAVVKSLIGSDEQSTFGRRVCAGLRQAMAQADPKMAAAYEAMAGTVSISPQARQSFGDRGDHLGVLQECIADQVLVHLDHHTAHTSGVVTELIKPLALRLTSRGWCLIHQTMDGQWRSVLFRDIERIRRAPVSFRPMPGDELQQRLDETWDVDCSGALYHIELLATAETLVNSGISEWRRTCSMAKLPNGSYRVCFDVRGLEEVARWIMGQSGLSVQGPHDLRDCMEALSYERDVIPLHDPSRELRHLAREN